MSSLYKLITKTNLKSPAIAFPLVMPFIFILLYSANISGLSNVDQLNKVIATFILTILSIQTMQSGLMGFGMNFISIKQSVLLRRIGATKLKKTDVIFAVLLYGLTLWVISIVWIFLITFFLSWLGLFYSPENISSPLNPNGNSPLVEVDNVFSFLTYINWLKLSLSLLVMLFASYSFGLFISSIAHDKVMFQGIVMLYFFFAGFMGGMFIPGDIPPWMEYIGFLIPHVYANELFQWATPDTASIDNVKLIFDFIVPLSFAVISILGAIKFLKFD